MLKEKFEKEIVPQMVSQFGLKNKLAAPRIKQVVLNVGLGRFLGEKETVEKVIQEMAVISGQKPILTQAKRAISSFKIRQGQKIGLKVTLRGLRMWDFIERLVFVVLPRVRDFRGLNLSAIDAGGNLTIGIKEHIVFPEVSPDNIKQIFGLQVCLATTAKNHEQGLLLFKMLGFPIKEK